MKQKKEKLKIIRTIEIIASVLVRKEEIDLLFKTPIRRMSPANGSPWSIFEVNDICWPWCTLGMCCHCASYTTPICFLLANKTALCGKEKMNLVLKSKSYFSLPRDLI